MELRPHRCDMCEKTFLTISSKRKHITGVHEKKRVQCEYCNQLLSTKITLKEHKMRKHSDKLKEVKFHVCDISDFKAVNNQKLNNHQKIVHLAIKNFKSKHCEKSKKTYGHCS